MKKSFIVLMLALVLAALSSCSMTGKDGSIYGQLTTVSGAYFPLLSVGGFPTGTLYTNTKYKIDSGTYAVYYTIYYGGYYYPGNSSGTGSSDSSYYWKAKYTVNNNKGAFLKDGDDKNFTLNLTAYYGLRVASGDATLSYSQQPAPGSAASALPSQSSWTSADGDITVTVENQIVQLSADEKAKLVIQQNTLGSK